MPLSAKQKNRSEELSDGRWCMSGLGPSEKEELKKLKQKKWRGVDIESLLEEGEVNVVKVNRDGSHGKSNGYGISLFVEKDDTDYELGATLSGRYMTLSSTYAHKAKLVKFLGEPKDKYEVENLFEYNYNAKIKRKNL